MHSDVGWSVMLKLCGHRCVKCGKKNPQKDHVIPVSAGGSDGIGNLQPLCSACNLEKLTGKQDYRPKWLMRVHRTIYNATLVILHLKEAAYYAPPAHGFNSRANALSDLIKKSGEYSKSECTRIAYETRLARYTAYRAARSMLEKSNHVGNI